MTPPFTASDQPDEPLPIAIRGPAALAAALPYLLHVPVAGRLVITTLEAGRWAQGASYVELPDFPRGGSAELRGQWADDVGALAAEGVLRVEPDDLSAAVVLYLPADVRLDDRFCMERIRTAIPPQARARMVDVVAVGDGRWRSIMCRDDECCPGAGQRILDDPEAVRVSAELVGAGLAIAPEPDPAARARVRAALGDLPWPGSFDDRQELLLGVWPLVVDPGSDLDPRDAARLVMAADRPGVRDALLSRLARAAAPDAAPWALQEVLWDKVAALAPIEWAAGPACMLAVALWGQGDLAGAARAADLALSTDPAHRMAGLIERLVEAGVAADDWMHRLGRLDEAACLRFDRPPTPLRAQWRPAV